MWAAAAAVIWQALQYYPMWYLQKTHGPMLTAVFGSVRMITQIVVVGAVTVVAVVQTSITKQWESQSREAADRRLALAYKATSLLMLAGCVAFAMAAGPIMRLFPPSYGIGTRIVPLCLLFFLISSHLTFLAIHFALIERMRDLFWPWALGLTGNVVLSALFVTPDRPATDAIVSAAWAGSLGLSLALAAAIALLRWERRPIDAGTVIFWIAIYILPLPLAAQCLLFAVLLVLVTATGIVFTSAEKEQMGQHAARLRASISHFCRGADGAEGRP
jgi:O-antigen/teichoic acid export membrane protein